MSEWILARAILNSRLLSSQTKHSKHFCWRPQTINISFRNTRRRNTNTHVISLPLSLSLSLSLTHIFIRPACPDNSSINAPLKHAETPMIHSQDMRVFKEHNSRYAQICYNRISLGRANLSLAWALRRSHPLRVAGPSRAGFRGMTKCFPPEV